MLEFIGTGSAFNTELGNNGAFIKKDNVLFMIDCGSSTFGRIQKSGLLRGVDHVYVLLTHTHPDHIGSLGDLIFYGYYSMGKMCIPSVTVMSPYGLGIRHVLKVMGVESNTYNLTQFETSSSVQCNDFGIKVYPILVNHVKELKCYGYTIYYNNKRIYYSGDANEIPEEVLGLFNANHYDYFYQDTCKADYEGNVHLSLRELDELIRVDLRDRVYCMHLDNGFDKAIASKLGFNVVKSIL